jgi:hypothetical protein
MAAHIGRDATTAAPPPGTEEPPADSPPSDEDAEISEKELLRQFAELEARSSDSRAAAAELDSRPTVEEEPLFEAEAPPRQRPVGEAPALITHGAATARLVVYQNKEPAHTHPIENDETLLGRSDPVSGSDPDLDLTPWDDDIKISRKHCVIQRMGGQHFIYPLSSAGTQVGGQIVEPGTRHPLSDGEVIILSMALALKFHTDEA